MVEVRGWGWRLALSMKKREEEAEGEDGRVGEGDAARPAAAVRMPA